MDEEYNYDYLLNSKGLTLVPSEFNNNFECCFEENDRQPISLLKRSIVEQSKFSDMLYNTDYYQVRPGKLLKYSQSEFKSQKRLEVLNQLNCDHCTQYQGDISPMAQKRIKRKMEVWYQGICHHNSIHENVLQHNFKKLVFLTVTLSAKQIHSDQHVKEFILKPFLRKLKSEYNLQNYLWKAESQANGNIHFHIILDLFIDKVEIQQLWNSCQNSLGYIDRYFDKNKKLNPPSTQIEAVDSFKSALDYIDKYVCKTNDYRKIDGAIWKASKSVMSLEYFEFVSDSVVDTTIDRLVNEKKIDFYTAERYSIYYTKSLKLRDLISDLHFQNYQKYLNHLDNYLFNVFPETSFRSYCYSIDHPIDNNTDFKPFISKPSYPMPIQLRFEEFDKCIVIKERVNKREKPNIYKGPVLFSS